MRLSLKWLSEYVDLRLPPRELADRLTKAGLAVDNVEDPPDWGSEIRAGLVTAVDPHPNADRLRLVSVDVGDGETQRVVCGAPNVAVGQKIAFGSVGARVFDGRSGKESILKPATIRGVESAGMVLSERELGISDEHEGILVLPPDAPIGKPLADVIGDVIFELSVTPNRPDWLSVVGVAREVAALTGADVREPSLDYADSGKPIKGRASVDIEAPDLCGRYIATVIENVTIEESPAWLKQRLEAIGQRPINNVVDITNYVMFELGQPLHAFDYDEIAGRHIIVRRGEDGERFRTLDGEERALTSDMLVIADDNGAVALAGVMGGLESEVVAGKTKNILLEAANFAGTNIRRTATALKMRSEASARFEKGLPPELVALASKRATKLLVEIAGGRALAGAVDAYPGKRKEQRIEVTKERIARVLGIDPPASKVRTVLGALGFTARWIPPDRYAVRVPYWRTDVRIDDDVAEEVGRIIGYDEIPTALIAGSVPPPIVQPLRELRERAAEVLAAAGMREVITYSLTTAELLARVTPKEDLAIYPPVRVANPITSDHEVLRTTLRASLLQTAAENLRFEKGEMAIFETARVYHRRPDGGQAANHVGHATSPASDADAPPVHADRLPEEREHVAGVITGRRLDRWGRPGTDSVDFFDAKAYVQDLLGALRVEAEYAATNDYAFAPGRTAEVRVAGQRVGVVGQIHPDVATLFDIDQDVYVFDITLDDLLPHTGAQVKMTPVPRFPAVEQDLALIVDEATAAGALLAAIESSSLVREAHVFDVYRGDQVPSGKKSVAFSIVYQAPDHTLTDDEVAKAQRKLLERLRREFDAIPRGAADPAS